MRMENSMFLTIVLERVIFTAISLIFIRLFARMTEYYERKNM